MWSCFVIFIMTSTVAPTDLEVVAVGIDGHDHGAVRHGLHQHRLIARQHLARSRTGKEMASSEHVIPYGS
jgi:hypothetical protein